MAKKGMTIDEAIKDMKRRREKAVQEAVTMIQADAMLLSPVDTGHLKGSITHEVVSDDTKTTGAVGSNVEYAGIVEYKEGFLEQSVDMNLEEIKRRIGEVLKNG